MKCKFCGVEVNEGAKICSVCGKKISKDKFPTWAIVLIVLAVSGFFLLPFIGVVAAITLPTLINNTNESQYKMYLKKTCSTLSQAYLMEYVMSDKYYSDVDDVWSKSIKSRVNYTDIENGIKFADLTELKIEKLKQTCTLAPSEPSNIGANTACAKLILDVNGFSKAPNKLSTFKQINDRFVLWMYSDKVVPANNSIEDAVLYNKLK